MPEYDCSLCASAVSAALTAIAVFLCALSGGTGVCRLSFALRWALPLLMAAFVLIAVPRRMPEGLFPILGAGGLPLGAACAATLGAASPVLMLLLPPPEIVEAGEAAKKCPVPPARFFALRVFLGAGAGALLLFAASVLTTYEVIAERTVWGDRMRVSIHGGIGQTLLTALEVIALALLAANMLAAAQQALARVRRKEQSGRPTLFVLAAALLAVQLVLADIGVTAALAAAPVLVLPVIILLCFHRRLGTAP